MSFIRKYSRYIAVFLIFTILSQVIIPNLAFGLTSGPSSPEFSSFEPVATTNMVNESSGGFTYNIPVIEIPGPDGAGYALSLSYHSGASPEEEASWVGYGWSLNPGAINRGTRGFPDDWDGKSVTYMNKNIPNKTVALSGDAALEFFSASSSCIGGLSANGTIRYNNYKGFGLAYGAGINFGGVASLGYNVSDGDGSFSFSINPAALLTRAIKKSKKKQAKIKAQIKKESKESYYRKLLEHQLTSEQAKENKLSGNGYIAKAVSGGSTISSTYGALGYSEVNRPSMATPFYGYSFHASIGFQPTPTQAQIGVNLTIGLQYTTQTNLNRSIAAYGYMYTTPDSRGKMQDYHYEKESNYNKRDVFIGIPFNDADNFMVTGEGIEGGFRLFPRKIGSFAPASVESETNMFTAGAEFEAGFNFGGGTQFQYGNQSINVFNWSTASSSNFSYEGDTATDEPVFFRFNGDLGGDVLYSDNDEMELVDARATGIPGFKSFSVQGTKDAELEQRSERSSYIGYTLNKDMLTGIQGVKYKAYCKRDDINALVNRNGNNIKNQIGEFSIVNNNGIRYNYGLPVYSRKESSMSYNINLSYGSSGDDEDYYIGYKNITSSNVAIGEIKDVPYATTFLLTEILTPDYLDRTNDGPTPDDFGGYTKFTYSRHSGTYDKSVEYPDSSWYKWRSPYTGVYINRNELSNTKDNMGSITEGEKELYYLDSVLTKTHLAVFYKSDRDDGLEANHDETIASLDSTAQGSIHMLKLDSIELYALGTDTSLIKTVHFKYSYDLAQGVINNNGSNGSGKLTLEKVWTDYNGIYNPRISPYEFVYEYPNFITTPYPAEYANLYMPSTLLENPDYYSRDIDAWGNHLENGTYRYANMMPWLNQTPSSSFDPAAWQLKRIKLPSGGEIQIQYEQNDYAYVQNQLAHVMINLSDYTNGIATIDVSSTGGALDLTSLEATELANKIQELYVDGNKKMYFKFLYKLLGQGSPNLNDCTSEYIDGYVNVDSVSVSGTLISLYFENNNYNLPEQVCHDYVVTQRAGNITSSCGSGPSFNGTALEIVDQFINFINTFAMPSDICLTMDPAKSYLRIPSYKDKKGGGIRVKRLLMYDNGIGAGNPELYGNEYTYKFKDDKDGNRMRSSGVATNEPQNIRMENVLVQPVDRIPQSWFSKAIAGRDRKQVEGPIGESILPAPSVTYSRVVINNIHSGKTSPGYAIKEFYTYRDEINGHPLINVQENRYSALDNDAKDYCPLITGFFNRIINNIALSQGFLFKTYDFNGKPKVNSTYAGNYYFDDTNQEEHAQGVLVASEEYEYFKPEDGLPVLNKFSDLIGLTKWDDLERLPLGKEVDMTYAAKTVQDHYSDIRYEFDADVGFAGPIPIPFFSIIPYINNNKTDMYLHATTKVVRYPAVVKSIKSISNNVEHIMENKAFDPLTGKALVTVSHDGFYNVNDNDVAISKTDDTDFLVENGTITNYSIPASQEYSQMGQKAENEKAVFRSKSTDTLSIAELNGKYYLSFKSTAPAQLYPENTPLPKVGDLIEINNNDTTLVCNVTDRIGNYFQLEQTYYSNAQGISLDNMLGEIDNCKILRSANTNMLGSMVNTFTIYGDSLPNITADSLESYDDAVRIELVNYLNAGDTFLLSDISGLDTVLCNYSNDTVVVDIDHQDSILVYVGGTQEALLFEPGSAIGQFAIDTLSGRLIYISFDGNLSNYQYVDGFEFCGDTLGKIKIQNVIANSQLQYSDNWSYNESNYYPANNPSYVYNDYDKGFKGKFRQSDNYSYRVPIRSIKTDTAKNFSSGMYELEYFLTDSTSYRGFADNDYNKWLHTTKVNKISPCGNTLEKENILGIKSSAKFGYNNTVPYLVASNSDYDYVLFESFENVYQNNSDQYFEDGLLYDTGTLMDDSSHTGHYSLKLINDDVFDILTITYNPQGKNLLEKRGVISKIWVKKSETAQDITLRLTQSGNSTDFSYEQVAQVGLWELYEAKASLITVTADVSVSIVNTTGEDIRIDDIRIQPSDAQVNAYVYDVKTLKPVAVFDDQHFGLLYQYNAEGKLIRKMKETVNGVKTITETQYNRPKEIRTQDLYE